MGLSTEVVNQLHSHLVPMDRVFAELKVGSRENFLSLVASHFSTLSESAGAEPTLRRLGLLVSMSEGRDKEVNAHTRLILTEVSGKAGPDLFEACPVCGSATLKTFECGTCGFSHLEDFRCPHLSKDGQRNCGKVAKPCDLIGLEFEVCEVFNK